MKTNIKLKKKKIATGLVAVIVICILICGSSKIYGDTGNGTIQGLTCNVSDGAYYNSDQIINFTYPDRDEITATVDGPIDSLDGELKADFVAHDEGEYILTFKVGKVFQRISFVIDKTPPVIKIGGKVFKNASYGNLPIDGGTFKLGVAPEIYDEMTSVKATISKNNGEEKELFSGYLLDEVANYRISVVDKAGNSKIVTFFIQDVKPVITVEKYNTEITTRPITVYASISDGTFSSVGRFPVGLPVQSVTTDGTMGVAFDGSFNGFQTITQSLPVTIFNNIKLASKNAEYAAVDTNIDNKIYKEAEEVKIAVPTGAKAVLDGLTITDGTICYLGGEHILVITSGALTNTVKFSIDKTAPSILGADANTYYNVNRHIYVLGGFASYKINDIEQGQLILGEDASEDGHYVYSAIDYAGNTSTLEFDIDRTPPMVDDTVGPGGYVFPIGSITRYSGSRYIDVTSDKSIATVSINGIIKTSKADCYLNSYRLAEDYYYVAVEDKAGNQSYFTIILDSRGTTVKGVTENGVYNSPETIVFENCTATIKYSTLGYYDAINTNAFAIKSGYEATKDGYYIITTTDSHAITNTIHFKIDRTPPSVKYNGKKFEGGIFNQASMSFDISGHTNAQLLKAGVPVPDWNQNKSVTEEGKYELNVTDEVNKLNLQFVIDRTSPIVEGVLEGWVYTTPVVVSYADLLSPVSGNLNGNSFSSGTTIDKNGRYTLVVTDSAGNNTIRSFTMEIPGANNQTTVTPLAGPKIFGVANGKVYSTPVVPQISEGTALLNGEEYVLGTPITAEGDYSFDVFGVSGGFSTVGFSIDKTAPKILVKMSNGKVLKNRGVTTGVVKVVVSEENPKSIKVTKNGKNATYGNGSFKFKAKYVVTAVDAAGNKAVTTFTIK